MSRMGIFLSEEGGALAPLNLQEIAERLERELQEVDQVFLHPDLNTVEGVEFVKSTIVGEGLTYVVIGAGSADRREENIRQAIKDAGGNAYLLEMVNLREGVAWVHDDEPEEANQKAFHLLRTAVKRVQQGSPLEPGSVRVEQQVLIVGGGIAGMTAAIRLADAGYTSVLVERSPTLGGRLARIDRLWPRLDEAESLVRDLMIRCDQHEDIVVYDYSEVEAVEGVPGNFEVAIRRHPRYVVTEKMDNLEEAIAALPAQIPDEHQAGLAKRAALYHPFDGAVPALPLVDPDHANQQALGPALGVLPEGALNLQAEPTVAHERVGAIILAVGAAPFVPEAYPHLGFGKSAHVLSALEMERLLSVRGPTGGEVTRPADGQEPRHLTWLVDVGSEDPVRGVPYSSEVPLMVAAKQAVLVKKALPEATCVVVYKDLRSTTRGYREFVRTAEEEYGVEFVRGEPSAVTPQGDGLVVGLYDLVQGAESRLDTELAILSTEVVPHAATKDLASALQIGVDESGFVEETHPALDPCSTPNTAVFVAGDCGAPGDLRAAVLAAEAAVSKALGVLGKKKGSPYRLVIRDQAASRYDSPCLAVAPDQFEAVQDPETGRRIRLVGEGGLQSGAPIPASPTRNIELTGWELAKSLAEIENLWSDRTEDREREWSPRVTGFVSQQGGYPLLEMMGRERRRYSPSYRFLRVWSSAHLDPLLLLKSFFRGADGIMVIGGPLGKGRFHRDNHLAARRFDALRGVLDGAGIEPARLSLNFLGTHQVGQLADAMHDFLGRLSSLGPLGLGVATA